MVWKWDRLINWTGSRKQGQTNKPDSVSEQGQTNKLDSVPEQGQTNKPDREPETGTDQQAGQGAGNRDRPISRTGSRKQGQTNKLDSVSE